MKCVYYKSLLEDRLDLSATERIVYSFLVYNGLSNSDDAWDKETGEFDVFSMLGCPNEFSIPPHVNNSFIHAETAISTPSIYRIIHNLETKGIVNVANREVVHNNIFKNGFFELQIQTGLKGELLIFYSWLKNLAPQSIVFCSREKIASLYHVEMKDVRDYIQRLKRLGFVTRDKDNKLIII